MILKYKGFNKNWVYVECEKEIVCHRDDKRLIFANYKEDSLEEDLIRICKHYEYLEKELKERTGFTGEIIWRQFDHIYDMTDFVLVMIDNEKAYGIASDCYLMTNDGKTVDKIF